jgi:hypothetical protein
MQPHLPKPIADYIAADNGDDKEAFGLCFNDNAVVRDEGHTYEGLTAIENWRAVSKAKYRQTVVLLDSVERNGKTIVTSRLTGNFPGSPADVDFAFSIVGRKIAMLEIGT